MSRYSASASRRDAAWRAAILSGALLGTSALPAAAQTMVFGGSTSPDVIVNEDVIESLGPSQTLPGLLRYENSADTNNAGLRPFTLHPPRAHRTAAVPKPKPQAEDQAQQSMSAAPSPQMAAAPTTARPQRATKGKREAVAQTRPQAPAAIPSKQRTGKASRSHSLQQAALPTAAPPPTATAPSAPAPQLAATAPSAPAPQPAASPPPAPAPAPSAPAPQPAASSPPAPSGPVPSIVRRYPAGTGASMLAASSQRPSSPPAPAPQASTTSPPAAQTAAAPPVSAPPPAAPAPSPSPAPATQSTPQSTAAPSPSPAPATQSTPPSAAASAPTPAPAPATQVASAGPTPAASPQPAPSAQPAPQVAALPPQGGLPALPTQVVFAPNVTDMPDQAKATLGKVIAAMKADEQVRIQLAAYASGLPDQSNQARRVSLSRAIGVRSYLIEQGIKSARIDVRALGNRADSGGPPDRVDIVAIDR